MKSSGKATVFAFLLLFGTLLPTKPASAALFTFSSHTFTNCSATGQNGPTQAACRSAYSTTWDEADANYTVTGGIQKWTVPQSGSYTITAAGAVGGGGRTAGGSAGGNGAILSGTFNLTEGSKLRILIGQAGTGNTTYNGGGGGGTFVMKETDNSTTGIYVIAGGGGGGGHYTNGSTINASTTTSGQSGWNGNSNTSLNNGTASGNGGANYDRSGGGGGGLSSNGYTSVYTSCSTGWHGSGGNAFVNGGAGGTGNFTGGFGGGGSGDWCYWTGGGGGGGYSGGSGGYWYGNGGGGGSYNNGSSQSGSATNNGQGYVTITALTLISRPTISVSPQITGTTTNGQILTTSTGTWANTPTSYVYQWSRSASVGGTYNSISGANNSSYTLNSSDVGKFLKVAVTATNSGGSATDTSSATASISAASTSATISIAIGALYFRTVKSISATPTVNGKITFKANNVVIPGCKNLNALSNSSVSCNYKPNTRGFVTLSATLIPADSGYLSTTVTSANVFINQRSGAR